MTQAAAKTVELFEIFNCKAQRTANWSSNPEKPRYRVTFTAKHNGPVVTYANLSGDFNTAEECRKWAATMLALHVE